MSAPPRGVTVTLDPISVHQSSIRDFHRGGWRKDLFRWVGVATLEWDGKKLPAVVVADSKIEDTSRDGAKAWEPRLLSAAGAALRHDALSAFRENDVTHDLPDEGASLPGSTLVVPVTAGCAERLGREHEIDQRARQSFEHAVKSLRSHIEYGVSSEAESMCSYIRDCLAAGYLGTMYGWYQEKTGGIRTYMDYMARRKNKRHEGYRSAQDYILHQLYSFDTPEAWLRQPPTLDLSIRG